MAERITGLKPELVVIVMKAIAADVQLALVQAGLDDVPTKMVPFPRPEWKSKYVDEVSECLERRRHDVE